MFSKIRINLLDMLRGLFIEHFFDCGLERLCADLGDRPTDLCRNLLVDRDDLIVHRLMALVDAVVYHGVKYV